MRQRGEHPSPRFIGYKRHMLFGTILYGSLLYAQFASLHCEAASLPDRGYEQLQGLGQKKSVRRGVHRRAAGGLADHLGPAPDPGDGWWNTTYEINGQLITLGEVDTMLRGARPTYDELVVCAPEGVCCPAYCCSIISTVHELQKPMDMSFMETQTATISDGLYRILSSNDLATTGQFAALIYREFDQILHGPWTLQIDFSKPVVDLHSYNAAMLGSTNGGRTYFLGPVYWNKDIWTGLRRTLIQGQTTPETKDGLKLNMTGLLYYDPTLQPNANASVPKPPLPIVAQEPRPLPVPPPVPGERYNLAEALQLSLLFYEIQRSGRLPSNKRIPWRGDADVADRSEDGKDLAGGWYDAGDTIKMVHTMGYSASVLLWGITRWPEAYEKAGQLDLALEGVKWALDFFIKAHTGDKEMHVQVSDEVDHCYWLPPEAPITYTRRAYKVTCDNPGSQPVMQSAAALAAGSLAFAKRDSAYAATLLTHARSLFAFAESCPGDYVLKGRIPAGGMYPPDGQYLDEHAWAAIWLYKATREEAYLDRAKELYWQCCSAGHHMENPWRVLHWADVSMGVNLLLFEETHWDDMRGPIEEHMDTWLHKVKRTPKGLAYLMEWGPNRFAASAAFMGLVAAELGIKPDEYRAFAVQQINYLLGDCCLDPDTHKPTNCHLVGFGDKFPRSVHHRAASCEDTVHVGSNLRGLEQQKCSCSPGPNVHTVWGGLVGGPDDKDRMSQEGCSDFVHMEVALDYNAAFTGAVAGLKMLSVQGKLQQYEKKG